MANTVIKMRRSLIDVQNDYTSGKDPGQLEKLMIAWQFIMALPPTDPNSFFALGGYHGEPFAGRGSYDAANYWGGHCNHGNILFPTWHRAYLYKLEKALQSVPGCESVMLPYWDQTYKQIINGVLSNAGIPSCLTDEYFTFKDTGARILNPLRSFKFPESLQDSEETNFYSKPKGYETVRYPLSGLLGTPQDLAATLINNSAYYIPGTNVIDNELTTSLLNANVVGWLNGTIAETAGLAPTGTTGPIDSPPAPKGGIGGIDANYQLCLDAPYYTVFSNINSAGQWNTENPQTYVMPLELPHGEIHLAVGGINSPGQNADTPLNTPKADGGTTFNNWLSQYVVSDSNGDMGENETAGLDPIFFFHHCNVDRIFWIWQNNHQSTDFIDISVPTIPPTSPTAPPVPYAGTNNVNNQPPVGYEPYDQLDMNSPLYPFKIKEDGQERYIKSSDCFNIEIQLGYKYDSLTLDGNDGQPETLKAIAATAKVSAPARKSNRVLKINGINRAKINGSFVITAYATINGTTHYIGSHSVLSRWKVTACKNCMSNLEVKAIFPLYQFSDDELSNAIFDLQINGRRSNDAEFAKFTVEHQAKAADFTDNHGQAAIEPTELKKSLSANYNKPSNFQII